MQGYLVFQMYRAVVVVTNNTEICLNGSKLITGVITHYPANGDSSRGARSTALRRRKASPGKGGTESDWRCCILTCGKDKAISIFKLT